MTKRILGLDIGTNSIGWAVIQHDFEKKEGQIGGLGSRIIPMTNYFNSDTGAASKDPMNDFASGNGISKTKGRTKARSMRKLYQRDNLRRDRLHRVLNLLGFLPGHYAEQIDFDKYLGQFKKGKEPKIAYSPTTDEGKAQPNYEFQFIEAFREMVDELQKTQSQLFGINRNGKPSKVPYDWAIYYLRKKALSQRISKQELAWIILNFNQKRGYYQLRGEEEEEKKDERKFFQVLEVEDVAGSGETIKGKDAKLHHVYFTNGWKYFKPVVKTEDWIGKTKEFIITEKLDDEGNIKLDKDGEPRRSYKAVNSEEDWIAIKEKTQQDIDQSGKHIAEYIFDHILQSPHQKIRGKLIKTIERKYYRQELEAILTEQVKHHRELQSKEHYQACVQELYPHNEAHRNSISDKGFKHLFVDDIIFYQRPLKSKKSTIGGCQYEGRYFIKDGKKIDAPAKAAPKSHPLFQEFRLWQFLSNLKIHQKEAVVDGKTVIDHPVTDQFLPDQEAWTDLFDHLNGRKEIEQKHLLDYFVKQKLISRAEKDQYRWNYVEDKPYPANETRYQILSKLSKIEGVDAKAFLTNEREQHLWHIIYSVTDKEEFLKAMGSFAEKNGLDKESFQDKFGKFPPFKSDYAAYSLKAIKKMLPLMRMGKYWDETAITDPKTLERIDKIIDGEFDENVTEKVRKVCAGRTDLSHYQGLPVWLVGYIVYGRHSEAKDTDPWKSPKDIDAFLHGFKQHSLRNPVVEQVVTETLRVVRDIWAHADYGNGQAGYFDEIHIELGREMKNPADKRKKLTQRITENQNTNQRIKQLLEEMANDPKTEGEVRAYSPSHQERLKIFEDGIIDSFDNLPDDIEKIRKNKAPSKKDIQRYKLWMEQKYRSPYTGEIIPLSKLFTREYDIEHVIPQSRYFDDSLTNKVICEREVNEDKDNETGYAYIKQKSGSIIDLGQGKQVRLFTLEEYENHCRRYFKGNKTKLKKLLSEDIPEGFIERQMNDTRYISKFVKGILSNIVREEGEKEATAKRLIPINGAITSQLKNDWGLNDKWNEIVAPRFQRLNELHGTNDYGYWDEKINAFRCQVPKELAKGFNKKRIDHRHHALDALVLACTTRDHVNYLNSLNSERKNHSLVSKLRNIEKITVKGRERTVAKEYLKPWEGFTMDAKRKLETTIVSFKQNQRVINKATNRYWSYKDEEGNLRLDANGNPKKELTKQTKGAKWAIRKSLHKATVAGKVKILREKKGEAKLLNMLKTPSLIVDKSIKKEIKDLLKVYQDDLTALRKYLKKNPIKRDDKPVISVKVFEVIEATATRTELSDSFTRKQLDSVTDSGIQKILNAHVKNYLDEKGNEAFDQAFSPDGIEALNQNIQELNGGKRHKPIRAVRVYEEGNKFPLGEGGINSKKFVEADKGTNLFFSIYWDEEKQTRNYETIPLIEVIEHQKLQANLPKEQRTQAPIKPEKGKLLFSLSPNELVYVPTEEEISNPSSVEFAKLTKDQVERVYKMVSSSGSQCFLVKANISSTIDKKVSPKTDCQYEFTSLKKMEKSIDGVMIKGHCWKLKVNTLGSITHVDREIQQGA